MSLTLNILGGPGQDNALLVTCDSGQAVERLLFDCGEGTLATQPFATVQALDHLFFSHFHMDHIAGFDSFFRATFNRTARPNHLWGPPGAAQVLQHRFQGYLWNLHEQMQATWLVHEVYPTRVTTTRFELQEAFAVAHDEGTRNTGILCDGTGYTVEACSMDHRTPTLAYVVREKPRHNIDTSRLASLGLRPGAWLKQLKDATQSSVLIDGVHRSAEELRTALLVVTPGDSVAYLTDFLLDESAMDRLAHVLHGCQTLVCEGQYRHADLELAHKNFHMTTVLSAELARRSRVGELILFHLSDRYQPSDWLDMLCEARTTFASTRYPAEWKLEVE